MRTDKISSTWIGHPSRIILDEIKKSVDDAVQEFKQDFYIEYERIAPYEKEMRDTVVLFRKKLIAEIKKYLK